MGAHSTASEQSALQREMKTITEVTWGYVKRLCITIRSRIEGAVACVISRLSSCSDLWPNMLTTKTD